MTRLERHISNQKRAVLLVAPTGSGKTAIGCHFIKKAVERNLRCIWLAHRSELIWQASRHLTRDYSVRHGIISQGKQIDTSYSVQVAMVQTLARREPISSVGLVVVDEAHHATASTYLKILQSHPKAIILGLTATPWRLTGKKLGSLFEELVAVANYPFLIENKYLVRPRVFLPRETPNFEHAKSKNDFDDELSAIVLDKPKLVGDVVLQWKEKTGSSPRSTIVFACNIAHSKHIVEEFRREGISAEHIDGTTSEVKRSEILEQLSEGKINVVSNVMLLSEGFDCPRVSCVVVARPTASRTLFIQMVGRALRPFGGKSDCIILDHAANSFQHGMVSDITDYELEKGDYVDSSESKANCKKCPRCGAVNSSSRPNCSECNCNFTSGHAVPLVIQGDLVEVGTGSTPAIDFIEEALEPLKNRAMVPSQDKEKQTPKQVAQTSSGSAAAPLQTNQTIPPNHAPVNISQQNDELLDDFAKLGAAANGYRQLLKTLESNIGPDESAISTLQKSLTRYPQQRLIFIKIGLLSKNPHIWLDCMAQHNLLPTLGLNCIDDLFRSKIRISKKFTFFKQTKEALKSSKKDFLLRIAIVFFASGVVNFIDVRTHKSIFSGHVFCQSKLSPA